MTPLDDHEPELGGDDALAAEYVLGVLPSGERRDVAARIDSDPAFAALVDAWEVRLAALGEGYVPVATPAAVKQSIDRRLFGAAISDASSATGHQSWWHSLALWRGLTAGAIAALAAVVVVIGLPQEQAPGPEPRFVASLEDAQTDVRFMAFYDSSNGELRLTRASGEAGAASDFELWLIAGDSAPVSLGVMPTQGTMDMPLDQAMRPQMGEDAVLAISVEPTGGSPTGQPTGPVVAAGQLLSI